MSLISMKSTFGFGGIKLEAAKLIAKSLTMQVDAFVAHVTNMSSMYSSDNVLITMGEDFNYQVANVWFKNLDKLIK